MTARNLPAGAGITPATGTAGVPKARPAVPLGKADAAGRADGGSTDGRQEVPGTARGTARGTGTGQEAHGESQEGARQGGGADRAGTGGARRPEALAGERTALLSPGLKRIAASMSEAELEEKIRGICTQLGLDYFHVRNPKGMYPGFPDDVIIGPLGVLWRENKRQGEQPTPAQWRIGERLIEAGEDWAWWRPEDYLTGRIARELTGISMLSARSA